MELIKRPLSVREIFMLKKKYGNYLKLTVDLGSEALVAGCELHADGESILIEEGGQTEDIWGGGINLETKTLDTVAVMNLRSNLENSSMEILDPKRREKFTNIIKKIFAVLWD